MSKANDPFEEYLRKKKVDLLETKFREKAAERPAEEDVDDDFVPPSTDDPELEARVKDEVEDFFTSGKDAGAKLFKKAGTGLPDNKVEEIRDALDDVFEEDAAQAPTGDDSHTFVDFFRQVRDQYDDPAPAGEKSLGVEVEDDGDDEGDSALEVGTSDISATAAEVSTDDLIAVEVPGDPVDARLSLNDILTAPEGEQELLQRVELLGRLVAKLIERAKLPESEIIEVLIRSGVEF